MTIGQDDGEDVPTPSRSGEQPDPHHKLSTIVMDDDCAGTCFVTSDGGLAVEARADNGDIHGLTNPDESVYPVSRQIHWNNLGFERHCRSRRMSDHVRGVASLGHCD